MKRVTYSRFDGIKVEKFLGTNVETYHTSRVSYTVPHDIELTYRYLKRFHPECRKLLDWSPMYTPSFGWWLEFGENTITLRSQSANKMLHDHVRITYDVSTKKLYRLALHSIADTMKWCAE